MCRSVLPRKSRINFKLTFICALMKFVLVNKLYVIGSESVTAEHDSKAWDFI